MSMINIIWDLSMINKSKIKPIIQMPVTRLTLLYAYFYNGNLLQHFIKLHSIAVQTHINYIVKK